jgi:hypothetical protein
MSINNNLNNNHHGHGHEGKKRSSSIVPPRHTVILSSDDSIVPTSKVVHYLEAKIRSGAVTSLEVKVARGPHGAMLTQPQWLVHIAQRLRQKLDTYPPDDLDDDLEHDDLDHE